MASHKHRSALLNALSGKEVPIETIPQEVLSFMGVEAPSDPLLPFSNEELPRKVATHTRPSQITIECIGAEFPMVLIDNGVRIECMPF